MLWRYEYVANLCFFNYLMSLRTISTALLCPQEAPSRQPSKTNEQIEAMKAIIIQLQPIAIPVFKWIGDTLKLLPPNRWDMQRRSQLKKDTGVNVRESKQVHSHRQSLEDIRLQPPRRQHLEAPASQGQNMQRWSQLKDTGVSLGRRG